MGYLDGKVAIITGAGQGVGAGIARAFAAEGAVLMLSGRTKSKVDRIAEEMTAKGGRVHSMRCDVTSPEDLAAMVDETIARFGGLDILINNAQTVTTNVNLIDMPDKAFTDMFDSGPLATFRLMKLCYPHLKARGGGAIVNFATAAAVRWDMAGYGPYAGIKQTIRSLTRAAATEWGPDKIRVNTIAPLSMSEAFRDWMAADPETTNAFVAQIPAGRVGDPEKDIGRAVLFLVGPDTAYLSGATIPLDGGYANFD